MFLSMNFMFNKASARLHIRGGFKIALFLKPEIESQRGSGFYILGRSKNPENRDILWRIFLHKKSQKSRRLGFEITNFEF